ncbi:cation efflux family-domain-containing protein, partial [Russula earlei]
STALPLGGFSVSYPQRNLNTINLVRSTSFILLQGVPPEVSLEDVRSEILAVNGVLSLHELHIWQLSKSKTIASVHINASRQVEFMPVACDIRRILHRHGIHSCTIKSEYHPVQDVILEDTPNRKGCLIPCPPGSASCVDQACCPSDAVTPTESPGPEDHNVMHNSTAHSR